MTKLGRVARLKNAHLTAKDVDDLVMTTDREDTLARVFLHHLAICPECNAAGGFILDAFVAGEIDETLDRLSLDLFRSRLSAPTLWKELEGYAPQEWKRIVRKKRRFLTWGLAEFLCDRTLESSHEPAATLATAELAVEVGTRISGWEDDDWIRLLRGYVWASDACSALVG